eukprot:35110-Chlamydomonas_euryale.AAC.1
MGAACLFQSRVTAAGFGAFSCAGCIPDSINGVKYVRDLYEKAGDTLGTRRWAGTGGEERRGI